MYAQRGRLHCRIAPVIPYVASFDAAVWCNTWSSGAASFVMWLGHLPSRTGLTFPNSLHRGSAQQQQSASVSTIPFFSGQPDLQHGHLQYCRSSSCQQRNSCSCGKASSLNPDQRRADACPACRTAVLTAASALGPCIPARSHLPWHVTRGDLGCTYKCSCTLGLAESLRDHAQL